MANFTPSEHLLSMSGFDYLQEMLSGTVPITAIAEPLNFTLHSVKTGRVAFRGTPLQTHANQMGSLHGGWYATLLDSAMACAVMSHVPKGSVYTTLEFKTNITKPIPLGMEIEALGISQHVGRSTGVANGEIRGVKDGVLYATGSTTCIIMKMK